MNLSEEELYWYWLYNIEGIGIISCKKLLEYYHSPKEVFHHADKNTIEALKITKKATESLLESRDLEHVLRNAKSVLDQNIKIITYANESYPKRLKNIYNPPGVLYLRGDMPSNDKPTIAIVGARSCSNYGKELATYYAKELARNDVQVISGLARGIDSFAHQGALHEIGKTYAILGSGIDICYPRDNINLYMDIIKYGGILSEYPIGYKPLQGNFVMRNRIISGVADGILIVEARERSGSLITLEYGLEQGKNIYACPGRVFDELSYGTNRTIQQGGKLILDIEDILEDFFIERTNTGKNMKKNNYVLERGEKIVYDILSLMPKHLEDIMNESGLKMNQVSEILCNLQLKGIVKQTSGNYFCSVINK